MDCNTEDPTESRPRAETVQRLRCDAADLAALIIQVRRRHDGQLLAYEGYAVVLAAMGAALDGLLGLAKAIDAGHEPTPRHTSPPAADFGDLVDGELLSSRGVSNGR